MRTYEIKSEVTVFAMDELDSQDRELVELALKATDNSYSPYSQFCVGAALRLENGEVLSGSNQENASYPLGLCAERTAIFHAQHMHPDQDITAIAIAARTEAGVFTRFPIPPCGACRQVMLEVEDRYQRPMRILLYGRDGIHVVNSVKSLLPFQFVGESMK
ncbi:MAG: cytidine deaminase [Bacteroidaceae bacterium]|nr:cytidine deaminase [Prevotellaceae bacterium]MDY5632202.1 cytidine deaminase [Bacteroidaceae bacterium]